MISDISDFYKSVNNEKSIISFIGEVTPDSLGSVLKNLEDTLESLNESLKIRKRIYNVLTEILQNLYHHSDEIIKDDVRTPSSVCVIDNNDDHYKIVTANYVKNDKIEMLTRRLDKINQLTQDELKHYYIEVLNNGEKSVKDGAGLGMIEISRKTGDKLMFEFIKLDNIYSLFVLKTKILK